MPEKLQFKSPLVSVASNPIPTRVLIERLDALINELDTIESPDITSLEGVAKDLGNEKLLKHVKDGVQPRVAYCIVDILHLYAPNASYDASKLESIFKLFISQFKGLIDPESKYYSMYVHVLKTSAINDIFALITKISDSDKLIDSLFETLYSVASHPKFEQILEPFVIGILDVVIAEPSVELSMNVLKMIMNKFLANTKVRKGEKSRILGFDITLKLCERNGEKVSRMVTKLLSDLLYEVAKMDDLDSDSDLDSDEEQTAVERQHKNVLEQKSQLNKIHTLIIELWRYVPDVLSSATGLLENELEADDALIRAVATKAVGHILSINSHSLNFATTHPVAFSQWLKKPLDVNPNVRKAWISQLSKLIENRSDFKEEYQSAILTTLVDTDERVRLATIYQLSQLKPSIFLDKVASKSIMSTMKQLVRDKHSLMRRETIKFLSTIYNSLIDSCEENDRDLIQWIPDEVLKLVYINDHNIEADVDLILFEKLIPFENSPEKRVGRFLQVVSDLSKKSQTALFALMKRQIQLSSVITQLFSLMEEYNFDFENEILFHKSTKVINWLASRFPSKSEAPLYLMRFFKLQNKRFYRLLTLCVSSASDYQTVTSGLKELLIKLSDPKNLVSEVEPILDPEIMQRTMKLFLLRASFIWCNISNVSVITKISKNRDSPMSETALLILDNISQISPILLKSNIESLIKATIDESNLEFRWRDLKAISNYANQFSDSFYNKICTNEEFFEKLQEICINGTWIESPYAVRILNGLRTSDKTVYYHHIFNKIWPLQREDTKLNTALATLGELFKCDYLTVESEAKEIGKYLTNEILFKNYELREGDRDWVEDHELDQVEDYECNSKLLAMRVFTKWLTIDVDDNDETFQSMGKHIIHTFFSNVIMRGGEITKDKNTPKRVAARLRLEASLQILELGKHEKFNYLINEPIIERLINCVQDAEHHVREGFMERLKSLLSSNSISEKFLPLTYFVAHDPEKSLREDIKIWIKASFAKQTSRRKNDLVFEKSWIRFLHMLHNHFELNEYYNEWMEAISLVNEGMENNANEDELKSLKETKNKVFKEFISFTSTFIIFVLNSIGTNENISLLYYLAQRIKQSYDSSSEEENPENSDLEGNKRLYFISDLTQLTINEIAKLKSWNLLGFSGKLGLPKDLFGSLERQANLAVSKTEYLPLEDTDEAAMIIRGRWRIENSTNNSNKPKKSNITEIEQAVNSQGNSVNNTGNGGLASTKKRRRNKKRASSSESETVVSSDNEEYHGGKVKNSDGIIRRSKRAKRVDYNEG